MTAMAERARSGSAPVRARLVPVPDGRGTVRRAGGAPHRPAAALRERIEVLRASDSMRSDEETETPLPNVDPARLALSLAGGVVEVVRGVRPASQLARWLAPGVLAELRERTAMAGTGRRVVLVRPCAVRRLMASPSGTGVEVSAAVDDGVRVRAVAFRLDAHRAGWRVTALEIG